MSPSCLKVAKFLTNLVPGLRLDDAECGLASLLFRINWFSVDFGLAGLHEEHTWCVYTEVSSSGNDWKPSGPPTGARSLPLDPSGALGHRLELELEEESVSLAPSSVECSTDKCRGDSFNVESEAPADGDLTRCRHVTTTCCCCCCEGSCCL